MSGETNDGEPAWKGLIWGTGYVVAGAALLAASDRIPRRPADALTILGLLSIVAGLWTLLVLGSVFGLLGISRLPRRLAAVVMYIAIVGLLVVLPLALFAM
ncbi:MAG: hypothetical protein JWL70_389 [Acidimicrobiia bacterium]|nr:hypothetical protein [Acidimicrobiia bacterium]